MQRPSSSPGSSPPETPGASGDVFQPSPEVRGGELALLLELSRILASQLELPQIYRQTVELVARTFGYALVSLYTLEGEALVMSHQVGYTRFIERIPLGQGTISRAVSSGQTVHIREAERDPDFLYALPGITSMVAVPIHARNQIRAVLCVEAQGEALSEGDARLLEAVALQVGGAVERGLLAASLLEGERLYRTLVETMPAALILYDGEKYVYANPRALQTLGLHSLEELQRRSFRDFSQSGAPLDAGRYRRVLQGEPIERVEDQLKNLRGEVVDLEVSAHPVELDGQVLGLVTWQDITQRKRAERALLESEAHYRYRVELSPQIPWTADPTGNITDLSQRWTQLTGMSPAETLGQGWAAALHPDDRARVLAAWAQSLHSGEPFCLEMRFRTAAGDYRWMLSRAYPRRDDSGQIVRWYGTTEDIHDRKEAEAALQRSESLHRTLMRYSREVVEILDPQGNLRYVSPNVALLGFDPEYWKTHPVNIFSYVPLEYRTGAERLLNEVLSASQPLGATVGPVVLPLHTPNVPAEWMWFEVLLENRLADPDIAGVVLRARDVTEQHHYQATIQHLAYHDELTGLSNRRRFNEQAEAMIHRAAQEGQPCALVYLDLDQFKEVNDSLGHPVGDELLVQVAQRLRDCVRASDLLARLGGDEMAILLPGADERRAETVAARVQAALSEPFHLAGLQVVVTASLGIALAPQHGNTLEALLRAADQALYAAKEGRNRWSVYRSGLEQASRSRLERVQDLRQALRENQLSLVFQPILPLRPGLPPKAEALLRWTHPIRGPIPPSEFIPLAEAYGLAPTLDTWVLKQVLRKMPPEPFEVCVNLSTLSLQDAHFMKWLTRAVQGEQRDPTQLHLEVTETALLRDLETARRHLEAVQRLGVRVALDDFGVGQTTLAYLNRLPVDLLKVDRSFVGGIGSAAGEALLAGILSLAKGLGMITVAEGVETAEQLAWLRRSSCDYAQGYFVGKPGELGQLQASLAKARLTTHLP
ncbi:MAG: EAL domain-containing protein [Thermaceae bacterium]|nr:EAL domain-containing protein [Thermaceae bacterium]